MTTRLCANPACGVELVRNPTESKADFRGRKCCSQPCNGAVIRLKAAERLAAMPQRACRICDKTLVRGEKERPAQFIARQCCSRPAPCSGLLAASIAHASAAETRARTVAEAADPDYLPIRAWPKGYRYHDHTGLDGWWG